MKKTIITILMIVTLVACLIVGGILWDKNVTTNEAIQWEKDADFRAEQNKKIQEADQKQAEYNESVGRPGNAN